MNVMTLKPHRYKGKMKKIGDEYEFVGRAERKLAMALGWVIRAPKYVEPAAPVAAVTVAPVVALPVVQEKPKTRRTYRRRDLVSEE